MHRGDAVTDYLRCFGNGDIDGPPGRFRSRDEYVTALCADRPVAAGITVIAGTGTADEVTVFQRYGRPGGKPAVGQRVRLRDGPIIDSLLAYDPGGAGQ